jgi:hypothetical protein
MPIVNVVSPQKASAAPASAVTGVSPLPFPEGCGNPYMDLVSFMAFYESTIQHMAAERGPEAKGVADLFAVWELRTWVAYQGTDPTTDSPLDRLIISQLCQFQRIETKAQIGVSKPTSVGIESSSNALHTHLSLVASRLYAEVREWVVAYKIELAKKRRQESLTHRKIEDIRKARDRGRAQVFDIIKD